MGNPSEKVFLIPWHPKSQDHYDRMYNQRVSCGWRQEEIAQWKEKHLKGIKCLYWIVLSDSFEGRETLLEQHLEKHPLEKLPLRDLADTVWLTPRTPTDREFWPIGHIALEKRAELDHRLGLPSEGVAWVMSLYVSWTIHNGGLGRSAMRQLESLAPKEPLNAKIIALDTVPSSFQLRPEVLKILYTDRGLSIPSPFKTNQDWYERQGYEVFMVEKDTDKMYAWNSPGSTEVMMVPLVYLKKDVL